MVCARTGDGNKSNPPDPDRMMVRARVKQHLENLKKRFPAQLGECRIHSSDHTDYRYRLFVPKGQWVEVIAKLSEEIDYGNFKGRCHDEGVGEDYLEALYQTWSVMHQMQRGQRGKAR